MAINICNTYPTIINKTSTPIPSTRLVLTYIKIHKIWRKHYLNLTVRNADKIRSCYTI